jgi:hypothetical protein
MMKKMMAGELEVMVADMTEMEKEKFIALFSTFVKAKLVLENWDGEEVEIEIGEILSHNVKAYDPVDGYEIHHESELLPL